MPLLAKDLARWLSAASVEGLGPLKSCLGHIAGRGFPAMAIYHQTVFNGKNPGVLLGEQP
jgi:hypothetical protein